MGEGQVELAPGQLEARTREIYHITMRNMTPVVLGIARGERGHSLRALSAIGITTFAGMARLGISPDDPRYQEITDITERALRTQAAISNEFSGPEAARRVAREIWETYFAPYNVDPLQHNREIA